MNPACFALALTCISRPLDCFDCTPSHAHVARLLCRLLYPEGGQGLRGVVVTSVPGNPDINRFQVFLLVSLDLIWLTTMAGRRLGVARCGVLPYRMRKNTAGSPSLRRETRWPHREEAICLVFFSRFLGMVTKSTDHCHLVLVDGEHAPSGL